MNTTTFSGTSLTANNATNLGGVAAATYVQTGSFNVVNTAGNGSFNLPAGWHVAFGFVVANSLGANAVTFANAFTSNAYSVVVTPVSNGTYAVTGWANAVTKTGFTAYCGNTTAASNVAVSGVYFMAIGF